MAHRTDLRASGDDHQEVPAFPGTQSSRLLAAFPRPQFGHSRESGDPYVLRSARPFGTRASRPLCLGRSFGGGLPIRACGRNARVPGRHPPLLKGLVP